MTAQAKHAYDEDDNPFVSLNKHALALKKGKSETLKADIVPGNKTVKLTWKSSNPKIAKVSSGGKVTAVAQGTVWIFATAKGYGSNHDDLAESNRCFVTVQGSAKSPKVLGTNDQMFYYGKTKVAIPNNPNSVSLANIKKRIGGYSYTDQDDFCDYVGLIFGSKTISKAHSDIYLCSMGKAPYGFGYVAKSKSPISTYRGLKAGAKKSAVLTKYGLPTQIYIFKRNGKSYEQYEYCMRKVHSKYEYVLSVSFTFQKSKSTVDSMNIFYYRTSF